MSVADSAPSGMRPSLIVAFQYLGLPMILLALVLFFSLSAPAFFSTQNISGMLQSASISVIMFLALTWVFAIGEMEVSFVAIAALSNMICAGLVIAGYGWPVAVILAMAAAFMVGLVNGLLIGAMRLPSLVITIATGGIAYALAAAIGLGSSIPIPDPSFLQFLFDNRLGPFPLLFFVAAALALVAWLLESRLAFGHYVFAIAGNRKAVVEAGVPVAGIVVLLCVMSAALNGFSGVLIAVELSSGQPSIAQSLFLDGLTAVLLGGTMWRLGTPNVLGTIVSVLIIVVLVRGGALLGWNDAVFQVAKGAMLVAGALVVALPYRRR